ncbi:MAG: hypothetical protein JWN70_6354 [Planctomycetaceae bacterium]|nr:hypothetical protein [Planctomycetaceae bacterium]
MNLDKRQKMLVGALAGILFLWQGSGVLWSIFFGPFDQRNTQIVALDEQLKKKKDAKFQLDLTAARTRIWERRSLPPSPDIASPLYHHWVLDLASKHHLEKLTVTPKRLSTGITSPVFTRIPISVTAECKMDQLCQFLYDFYRTDLLHKVTHLGVESLDFKANPTLKVSLELEGLSLKSAPVRTTLFAGKQETAVADAMSKKSIADYKSLSEANRFVRGYNGPPKPPTPPAPPGPPPTPFDSAPFTKLIATFEPEGAPPYAWLYDQSSNQRVVLTEGKDFEIAGIKGVALKIGLRFIEVKVKEKNWRLENGDNLKQMTEIKPDAPATATPASTPAAELPKKPPA